jgi:hypothetical protein
MTMQFILFIFVIAADDLLKNEGKKFLEMMERLAERRMRKEEGMRRAYNNEEKYEEEDEGEADDGEGGVETEGEDYEEEEEEDGEEDGDEGTPLFSSVSFSPSLLLLPLSVKCSLIIF